MPLRDHFRSPVNDQHRWDALHGMWPGMLVRQLFDILPPPYRAGPKIHLGAPFEIDAATFTAGSPVDENVQAELPEQDEYEVRIYDAERGRHLVAAIEIVSPSNKDKPATREVFVGKVVSLLQQGVCVTLIDLVSVRQANLYAELLTVLGRTDPQLEPNHNLYAVSLRARPRPEQPSLLDAWFFPLALGQPLPQVPIWLSADICVSLLLESSYEETCRLLHIA
jgi:hypothetical protein